MPAKKPFPPPAKVARGRRSAAEKDSRRWRLSIKEAEETKDGYTWSTWIVQGWQVGSTWQRRRFKSRAEAEVFKSNKELELLPTEDVQRIVITGLSQSRAREAEDAFALIDAQGALTGADGQPVTLSLLSAVQNYLETLRAAHAVERVPMLKALDACIKDKMARGTLRARSAVQLKSSVKLFTSWLTARPRFTAESLDPAWSPMVADVTTDDLAEYLASLRGKTGLVAAPKSWNNTRGDIAGFWQWCMGREGRTAIRGCKRRWALQNIAQDVPTAQADDHTPDVLSVAQAGDMMAMIERDHPAMAPLFALALFAGIRPSREGELFKLARHEGLQAPCREAGGRPLIDLERNIITIPASIAKTRQKRVIPIQPNLAAWLTRYGTALLPVNWSHANTCIRKAAALSHDVLRHSFISFRVAVIGKILTALEAGNSETIINKHYLNMPSEAEAAAFWGIEPTHFKGRESEKNEEGNQSA